MRHDFKAHADHNSARFLPNFEAERADELKRRDMDRAFQLALRDAWNRGEFPGQSFRLVAE